jgi:two-component system chemotaxis response regulator CheB
VKKTRVLVADDSMTVRKRLIAALGADPSLEVVGEAVDGDAAVVLCHRLRPSVITLDMMMPKATGIEVTERVMAFCPTPILIVSSSTERGEALRTFDALAAGAVDVIEKPAPDEEKARWDERFVARVKLVSRIKVITHLRRKLQADPAARAEESALGVARPRVRLIVVGASTGGPSALILALRTLPARFPVPLLLVLHIGAGFGGALVEWLGSQLALPVSLARHGAPLPRLGEPGVVMAPPDHHLVIREERLYLTTGQARHSCRPSVDVLFESVAAELGPSAIGCLLTGMGRDGAEGLLAMKRAGAATIAQDEASSVVFGMPREAIAMNAADHVLSVGEIGPALLSLSGEKGKR